MPKTFFPRVAFSLVLMCVASPVLANGRFPRAQRLVEHPSDPNQLVLGATYGLLMTKDRGASWYFACEASFAHQSSYTGDPLLDFTGDESLLVGVQTSMSVSTDQGCNWIPTFRSDEEYIVDQALAKSNPSTIVAAVVVSPPSGSISMLRESLDNGRTWKPIGDALPVPAIYTIDVDPLNPEHLYATGIDKEVGQFLTSFDHGATWTVHPIPGTGQNAVPYLAGIHPLDPNKIFVRTDATNEVFESGDALFYSADGGTTWSEVHRSRARLFGFALSPDASTVLIGYGEPSQGGAMPVPGPLGIFKSRTDAFSFEQIYAGHVNCLTWTKTGVYVCSSETRDGFELAFSPDADFGKDAGCLVPILHRNEVKGPLDCAPQTSGAFCATEWPASCLRLGACSSDAGVKPSGCLPYEPAVGSGDAGGSGGGDLDAGGSADLPSSGSGCSCRAAGDRPCDGAWYGLLLSFALFRAATRSRAARDRR